MKKLNMLSSILMAAFSTCLLTSCSSYELLYEYSEALDGYIVYSEASAVSRFDARNSIEIPDIYSYKPVAGISSYAFHRCFNLKDVVLPLQLKQIGAYSFSECASMSYIGLPKSLEIIDSCAFKGSGLKKIVIPSSVNFIGLEAFSGCPLEEIIIEEDNSLFDTTKDINAIVNEKDKKLLTGCKNTVIPDYVRTIGEYSFYGMEIEQINIPSSVEEILCYAFYNCNSLSEINISSNVKRIEEKAFSIKTRVKYDGTIKEFFDIYKGSMEGARGLVVECTDGMYRY